MIPVKKIFDGQDLGSFRKSVAYQKLHQAIDTLLTKVEGKSVPYRGLDLSIVTRSKKVQGQSQAQRGRANGTDNDLKEEGFGFEPDLYTVSTNQTFHLVVTVLNRYNQYIDETPPIEGPRRFGNLACKEWHLKIGKDMYFRDNESIITSSNNVDEMIYYLNNSFGSSIRLDFGTGHELSFLAFMGPLMDQLDGEELLYIFGKYYDVARKLIVEYNLEPAGSHGVWGLDDHFHLIYIIGAAQFQKTSDSLSVVPLVQNVLTAQVIHTYKLTNLYVNGIAFVFKIKLGPFKEHSPILYDIHTSVYQWSKVLKGLLKMYEVEVFNKFPVVQHFWFGQIYSWVNFDTLQPLPVNEPTEDKQVQTDDGGGRLPQIRNNGSGVYTTKSNISMTAAPWAMGGGGVHSTRLPEEFGRKK